MTVHRKSAVRSGQTLKPGNKSPSISDGDLFDALTMLYPILELGLFFRADPHTVERAVYEEDRNREEGERQDMG
jgi:hypothetical protein